MKNDRRVSLALSHARLLMARDTLRWAQSADTRDLLPPKEVEEMMAKIKQWEDACWKAMRDVR